MAFSAAQKQSIRNYLGAPGVYPDFQHRLEGALDVIGNNPEAFASAVGWLTRLQEIDDALIVDAGSSATATYGSLKKADDVEFYPVTAASGIASAQSTIGLVQQGRVLIQRLARLLGVSDFLPEGDYFGTTQSASIQLSMG